MVGLAIDPYRRARIMTRPCSTTGCSLALSASRSPGPRAGLLLALALLMAASGTALAQTPEVGAQGVEEYVVFGTQPVTATSTLTVPAEDFELRPLESGGQMIEAVPGALTAQHTGGGKAEQYFLRGFDADHGTDLSVYFDGVPINLRSHAHGQGYLDLHFVTKETIARLDVAKGPYSARFGDFATAATIEYQPFESLDESFVQFEAGEFETYRAVGLVSPRIGPFEADAGQDPVAKALFSFEAYHTDGPFQDDEDLSRFSVFGRGDVRVSPTLVLSGHLLGYTAEWNASGLIPQRLVDSKALGRFDSLDPTEGGETIRVQGKLQLDWEPTEKDSLTVNAYVAYYELDLYSNFTYALTDPVNGDGILQRDDRIYAGGRVEYQHLDEIPWPASLRAGVEWRYDDARVQLGRQSQRQFLGFSSDDDDDRIEELSFAPYVEIEMLPLDWVRFLGGVRFESFFFDVESRLSGDPASRGRGDDHLWLPKANLILSPFSETAPLASDIPALRDLDLFLNFGIGFHSNDARSGIADERILARAPGAEIGLRTRFFDRFSVSIGGFWLEIEDELVFVGDEGTTESSGKTRRFGVEFAARADLLDWLYLRGDVAYTSARFASGDAPVPQAPRFIAKGAAGVRLGDFVAELGVRHLGSRYASEDFRSPKLDSYTVLDLGGRYRVGPIEIGLAVENLTGARWRSSEFYYESCAPSEVGSVAACPSTGGGEGIGDSHFTPGNPRNVRGWIRYSF